MESKTDFFGNANDSYDLGTLAASGFFVSLLFKVWRKEPVRTKSPSLWGEFRSWRALNSLRWLHALWRADKEALDAIAWSYSNWNFWSIKLQSKEWAASNLLSLIPSRETECLVSSISLWLPLPLMLTEEQSNIDISFLLNFLTLSAYKHFRPKSNIVIFEFSRHYG